MLCVKVGSQHYHAAENFVKLRSQQHHDDLLGSAPASGVRIEEVSLGQMSQREIHISFWVRYVPLMIGAG